MKLYGLIGDLEPAPQPQRASDLFVNGRCVKSPVLTRAYEQAWEGLLMKHQYPAGIIWLPIFRRRCSTSTSILRKRRSGF